ncbi:MAG TPA: VCBS repeat-containing protein [Pyrinomonadaceae bacterium]|nr:VCBS repeat-containing protein [Pyrinomonadaceae bacterium]
MKIFFLTVILSVCSSSAFGTLRSWDGGGADTNWQTPANWVGDVAPVANDDLLFPTAAAQFTANNNFPLFTTFGSITIEGGTYTLSGNPLRLANGMTVGAGTQTINIGISLTAAQTFAATSAASTVTILSVSTGSFPLTLDGAGTIGIGLISGSGAITKNGTGAGAVISSLGYSGAITINNGIFVVDASIPNSAVSVNSASAGGTLGLSGLGGTGTVGAVNVTQGGISAGTFTSPTGILNISNGLTLTANGAYLCKIGGTTPGSTGHDQLNVTGAVNLGNARLGPLPWNGFRPAVGDSFVILKNDGTDPINGTFLNAPEGAVFAGPLSTAFRISYIGGDGNDVVITRVARAQFDFDADGRSDLGRYRASDSVWSIMPSGGGTNTTTVWGVSSDLITPADFDGDNRADIAVFRPSNGAWYVLNSFNSTVTITQFGTNGDIPRPNDFDGDGRADLAVFRPSDGVWYELRSLGNQFFAQNFGLNGDIPQMVDFDGDGIGDLCVYRPSEGTWHIFQSSNSAYVAFPFGSPGDKPVPADYDGDGKTDVAVFRATVDPNQPDFFILLTGSQTFQGASWGTTGDVPAVADYDGDGKADIAVYRPSTNIWYLLRTTAGFTSVPFGLPGDRIIPAAYVP